MLTPATQTQLALSRQLAKQMGEASTVDIHSVIEKCLGHDRSWVAASKKALLKATKQQGLNINPGEVALKKAFDAEAQRILQSAHRLHRSVLKPVEGVSYEMLSPRKYAQAIAVQTFFRDRFLEAPERILFAQSLRDALVFELDTAEKFEQAVLNLGKAIGILSQRPERELGEGPDNLWRLRDGRFHIVECKNGSMSTKASRRPNLGNSSRR
jgi:hypothetical protein